MKLSIKQRLDLYNLLPQTGNELEIIAVTDMQKKLLPNEEEIDELNFKVDTNGRAVWENETALKEIEFSGVEASVLKTIRRNMDEQKLVTVQNLSLMLEINKL